MGGGVNAKCKILQRETTNEFSSWGRDVLNLKLWDQDFKVF